MGTTNYSTKEVSILRENGKFVKSVNHEVYGKCEVFQTPDGQLFCSKYYDGKQYKCVYNSSMNGVIKYLGQVTEKPSSQYCGDETITLHFYEFITISLKDYIMSNKSRATRFSEPDLWVLLWTIIRTCAYLQKLGLYVGDIRPRHILIDPFGQPKVVPYDIFAGKDGMRQAQEQGEPVFLSPELLGNLNSGQFYHVNRFKSDVYSLGLTLLECMVLLSSKQTYNFQHNQINVELIQGRINQAESQYSTILCDTVRAMLLQDESRRPDFLQLKVIFKPNAREIMEKKPFSVNIIEAKRAKDAITVKKFNINHEQSIQIRSNEQTQSVQPIQVQDQYQSIQQPSVILYTQPIQQPLYIQQQYFPIPREQINLREQPVYVQENPQQIYVQDVKPTLQQLPQIGNFINNIKLKGSFHSQFQNPSFRSQDSPFKQLESFKHHPETSSKYFKVVQNKYKQKKRY